jgi:L-asparaginase II
MLPQCVMNNQPIDTYLSNDHPIQKNIRRVFAEMTGCAPEDVLVGIDGCSAPTFAVPLHSAALAYARLCDPSALPEPRAGALRRIYQAMTRYPEMVAGPKGFDTMVMEVARGKVVSKGGAEGYQGMGIALGAAGPGSPAMGVVFKVIDGDITGRARAVVSMAVLRQLGVLDDEQAAALNLFDTRPIQNWRGLEVGVIRPAFTLERAAA